jgi:uncharacterized membrane protein YdbT with pleckstrin-like domain
MLKDASLGCLSILQSWFDEHQFERNRHPHVYVRFLWSKFLIVIKYNAFNYMIHHNNIIIARGGP